MTTELATSEHPVVQVRGDELQVSAATPTEMAQSQEALIAWAKRKIELTETEANELHASYRIAVERKWKSTVLKRHADLAFKRVDFYKKLLAALEAGYIIVPSFPVQVFAVRSERGRPLQLVSNYRTSHEQKATTLPAGEGEYKNPIPEEWTRDYTYELSEENRKAGKTFVRYHAEKWKDLEFPINMAKPNIMEAATRAMALKLFDDLGVLPGTRRNVDPIIVGRILKPSGSRYDERFVSFIIGWHLDTATL